LRLRLQIERNAFDAVRKQPPHDPRAQKAATTRYQYSHVPSPHRHKNFARSQFVE
jgi:hypothetical protein